MKKNKKKYITEAQTVSYLNFNIRSKCPYCGHTMLRGVYIKDILCDWCKRSYENNSRSYKLKKLKDMIKSE